MKPVIVIGPPRSGTSVIARLLQTRVNVMMDEGPIRYDQNNPKGYYEDQRLLQINSRVLENWKFGENSEKKMPQSWGIDFAVWAITRNTRYKKWGFKDPRMQAFLHWTFNFIKEPIFIQPIRTIEQIVKSQMDKLKLHEEVKKSGLIKNPNESFIRQGIVAYHNLIDQFIRKDRIIRINLMHQRSENELVDILGKGIELWQ